MALQALLPVAAQFPVRINVKAFRYEYVGSQMWPKLARLLLDGHRVLAWVIPGPEGSTVKLESQPLTEVLPAYADRNVKPPDDEHTHLAAYCELIEDQPWERYYCEGTAG